VDARARDGGSSAFVSQTKAQQQAESDGQGAGGLGANKEIDEGLVGDHCSRKKGV
jgi:hypothetical protein